MSKLLIVVDYQKDFVDGSLGFPEAVAMQPTLLQKIAAYRAAGDTVAFTFDTHGADYLSTQEGRLLPVEHTLRGTPGRMPASRTTPVSTSPRSGRRSCLTICGSIPLTRSNWRGWYPPSVSSATRSLPKPPNRKRRWWWTPPAWRGLTRICTQRHWM